MEDLWKDHTTELLLIHWHQWISRRQTLQNNRMTHTHSDLHLIQTDNVVEVLENLWDLPVIYSKKFWANKLSEAVNVYCNNDAVWKLDIGEECIRRLSL